VSREEPGTHADLRCAASSCNARTLHAQPSNTVKPSFISQVHSRSPLAALATAVLVGLATVGLAPRPAAAQLSSTDAAPGCIQRLSQYQINGTLRITDTAMGAGDGTFPVGPGTLVLRVDTQAARTTLVRFDLQERFAIRPNAVMWHATLLTDTAARAVPDATGAAASGRWLRDGVLRWDTPLHNYRSDGALTCSGSLCGKFGAPPPGRSELHQASTTIRLEPFRFDRTGQTFQMDFVLVSSSEAPRQRTYLAVAGRRVASTCLPADPASPAPASATLADLER
jgi:hypothetical protein